MRFLSLLLGGVLLGLLAGVGVGSGAESVSADAVAEGPEALAVRHLAPEQFAAAAGVPRRVRLVDDAGAAVEEAGEVAWAFVRVAQMQENRDSLEAEEVGAGWWVLPTPAELPRAIELEGARAGGLVGVVGVDLRPRVVEVSAADLRAFVNERGFIAAGELPRQGLVRVERVESFKAILRYGGDAGAPVAASESTSKTGQQVEIRPLMDPAATPVGSDLAVRVYAAGGGVAGARVRAVHVASGAVQDVQCADTGIGLMSITAEGGAGHWRLEMHVLRREEPVGGVGGREDEAGEAKWVLYSAMLAFEAPGAAAAGEGKQR
jgi:hypothetical protein